MQTPQSQGSHFQKQRRIDVFTFAIVVLTSLWFFYTPLRHASRIMPFVEDDFYYYLKVAQNIAAGGGSSFDGFTLTNGYHPLYMLVFVAVSKLTTSLVGVFRALWLLGTLAAASSFFFARKLLERPGSEPYLTNALALVFLVPCLHIFCQGMEVTLTLPLGLGLLLAFRSQPAEWSFLRAAAIGSLAALTVLSRLDAVFLVLLLVVFTLAEPKQRKGLGFRQLGGFAAGGSPLLVAYFVFNRLYFHTWMPISGSAKQLKSSSWPTLTGIKSGGLNTMFLAGFAVLAAIVFQLVRKRLNARERPWLAAAAAFPYLQIGVLSVVSDWPLWGWYFYSLRFALLAGLALLLAMRPSAWRWRPFLPIQAAAYSLALVMILCTHWKKEPQMEQIFDAAVQIQAFAQSHPGVYAMGDRAGMVGYLLPDPLVQTEGLMMDTRYLLHLRQQDDLLTTLHSYGVDYYIVSERRVPTQFEKQRAGSCFLAEEPYVTGPTALHMRATLCEPPVANFVTESVVNHVYQLDQPGSRGLHTSDNADSGAE